MKNKILLGITVLAAIMFISGMCLLDSIGTFIPLAMCAVGLGWIGVFVYANYEYLNRHGGCSRDKKSEQNFVMHYINHPMCRCTITYPFEKQDKNNEVE